ncbi:MAG: DNA photolyase [Deltaproteobacteria bacterium]|nr:MAG: DNA photolyase [Deltaproteobacteria bacterium]
MPDHFIKKILLDENTSGHPYARAILKRLAGTPVRKIHMDKEKRYSAETGMGKDTLHLLNYQGDFLKPCPGTRNYICCGYQILNLATNCPLNCSYCILQAYFNRPNLNIFINFNEKLIEILKDIDSTPDRIFRIGTGEFTDSLALDPVTGLSEYLLPLFSTRKNAVLELKTKTDRVGKLLTSGYRDRIVVSWSLNSPYICSREEHGAASLKQRLEAARICQEEGFVLAFHFDPIIHHDNWREGYLRTIELMDARIKPEGIIWISLGAFRFMPELKSLIRKRHPDTCVLDGEFIVGLDGKMRYFKPIRLEFYSYMRENLEKWHKNPGLYLCMESDDIWSKTMGWSPGTSTGLSRFLDARVREIFQ